MMFARMGHDCKPMGLLYQCPDCGQHWQQVSTAAYKCISRLKYDELSPKPEPKVGIDITDLDWLDGTHKESEWEEYYAKAEQALK
jgi:hypothetical protein